METPSLEKILQEGKLHRQLNSLIVAYLRENNFSQAAIAVASATMTPLNVEAPFNRLLEIFAKGIAAEKEDTSPSLDFDSSKTPKSISVPQASFNFSSISLTKGSSKKFPKHESKTISEHKNDARCAKFSADGRYLVSGSADTSIKLFEVSKIKQMMLSESRDGPRTVIRTFYDHTQPVNDLDFHPNNTLFISCAKDNTIKMFDFSKASLKKAIKVFQDSHNVRSLAFHPSGNFILAGTDHSIPHLYDVNTLQCYVSASNISIDGAINQVKYSSRGEIYATASKDGALRLWNGVTAGCIRSINSAHGGSEVTSVAFTKDQKYVLSCGKDSSIKLWEVGSGRMVKHYIGATHTQLRCPAVFDESEEFVLSIDERNNEIVVWDALSGEKVGRLPSGHGSAPRWLEHSPVEAAFVSCGSDRLIKFWKDKTLRE